MLVDKALNKVQGWFKGLISQAGKATLLKSVMNAIPTHILMNTRVSERIIKKMKRTAREFIWNQDESSNKMNLIGWQTNASPIEEGGLGIRDLKPTRKTNCAKRLVPLLNNENLLWVKVLMAKYGTMTPWNTLRSRGYS